MADDNNNDDAKTDSDAPESEAPPRKERIAKKTLAGIGGIASVSPDAIAKDAEEKAAAAAADAEAAKAEAEAEAAKAKAKAAEKAEALAKEAAGLAEQADSLASKADDSDSDSADSEEDSEDTRPATDDHQDDADDADNTGDDDGDDDHGDDGHGGHADGDDEEDEPEMRVALYLAEYETPDELMHAAEAVRDAGYEKWDCHTPYPVHGLDDAMGLPATKIGFISFIAAMTGLVTAVLMIQYMNNWDYPINIGGKPVGAGGFPAMVPIMFELTILLCGFGTLFGMLHLARLPQHYHPIFESDRFESATDDKFFISVEVADEKFDLDGTRALLERTSPSHLELVEEEVP